MSDKKKEVFDFLRNKQKAAEIEAKVNGINLWVLLGAIAIVSWQLIGCVGLSVWTRKDIVISVLLCAALAYLLALVTAPTKGIRSEVRYNTWHGRDVESPLLHLTFGILLLLPALASLAIEGKSLAGFAVGVFGAGFSALSIHSIILQSRKEGVKNEKFPKPEFSRTKRSDLVTMLVFALLFLASLIEQAHWLFAENLIIATNNLKAMSLLGTLYLLTLIIIRRKQTSHNIGWTYELETDLLLDVVTPEVALRRIEHRALGPRLQDVMDNFFDDIDRKFAELDPSMTACRLQLVTISDIPNEYNAERTARINAAIDAPKTLAENILGDCKEFSKYIKKISASPKGGAIPGIAALVPSLTSRNAAYQERAKVISVEIERLVERVIR